MAYQVEKLSLIHIQMCIRDRYKGVHYNEVAHASAHHEEVEDLVRTEVFMAVIEDWELQCIDDAADRVDDTAQMCIRDSSKSIHYDHYISLSSLVSWLLHKFHIFTYIILESSSRMVIQDCLLFRFSSGVDVKSCFWTIRGGVRTVSYTHLLAVSLEKAEPSGYVKEWKINGEAVTIGVAKRDEAQDM